MAETPGTTETAGTAQTRGATETPGTTGTPGRTVLWVPAEGAPIREERDATDLIGEAFGHGATWVVLPAARLHEDFFRLGTRVAGGIVQKFVNYRIGLVVLGDIAHHVAASDALRDFVRESNRGRQLWFLADEAELADRLAGAAATPVRGPSACPAPAPGPRWS
ncbi:DUF4180 domain-containing protein [Kitasatospora sp. NPDC090091]|uniref:DUF4180 domain-containing protein n=1 Tax=Kitasatospora sp. NPDC090091 TaxID=3364081 RepID=UPI00380EEA7D